EVVIFEPFYENYGPDAIICGAVPRFVRLQPPDWTFDPDELAQAFNERTRAVILNTPNNPTGKVFSRNELESIGRLAQQWGAYVITDEIYQYIVYDGAEHVSIATLPGMRERTITINGMSKTYSVTGWRVGYAIATPEVTNAIRKMHDFLTVGAPTPLSTRHRGGCKNCNGRDRRGLHDASISISAINTPLVIKQQYTARLSAATKNLSVSSVPFRL